jgi:hypothetical protein
VLPGSGDGLDGGLHNCALRHHTINDKEIKALATGATHW